MTRSGQGLLSTGNGSPIRKRLKQNISDRGYANGIDRISNLPDPIVSKILSFLPTKNAVATSALSKRWKPRWTKVTSFDFDDELWAKRRGRGKTVPKKDFAEFVEMVLKNQTADSTNQFRLRWNSRDQNSLNDASSETISVQGLASVREAELEKISHCDDDMVVGLVQALESVKCMKLGLNVMHTLSVASNKLSGSFARLTRLAVTCDPNQHMGCLVELMDCCVKLEVIKIVISMSEEPEDVSDQDDSDCKLTYWKDPVRVPSCLSSSLRQVAIRGFHDDNGLMAMLKFILDHGLVMERVNLWFLDDNEADEYEDGAFEERERCYDDIPVDYEERYRLLGKILMLSRASPACQIQDLSVS